MFRALQNEGAGGAAQCAVARFRAGRRVRWLIQLVRVPEQASKIMSLVVRPLRTVLLRLRALFSHTKPLASPGGPERHHGAGGETTAVLPEKPCRVSTRDTKQEEGVPVILLEDAASVVRDSLTLSSCGLQATLSGAPRRPLA